MVEVFKRNRGYERGFQMVTEKPFYFLVRVFQLNQRDLNRVKAADGGIRQSKYYGE